MLSFPLAALSTAMILPILSFPDPRLNTIAKPVAQVDQRISTLIADMLETMYDAKGIGLAATQVNVHERLVVIDVSDTRDQPLVLINPEITWYSPEKHIGEEGCLSVPEIYDAFHFVVNLGHGQAAFFTSVLFRAVPGDFRVDEHQGLVARV